MSSILVKIKILCRILVHAYNRVYPRLHDLLEREYRKYVGREYADSVDIQDWGTCDHEEWEKIIIHKIGVWYKCKKCFRTYKGRRIQKNFSKLNYFIFYF